MGLRFACRKPAHARGRQRSHSAGDCARLPISRSAQRVPVSLVSDRGSRVNHSLVFALTILVVVDRVASLDVLLRVRAYSFEPRTHSRMDCALCVDGKRRAEAYVCRGMACFCCERVAMREAMRSSKL